MPPPGVWAMYASHFILSMDFFIIAPTVYLLLLDIGGDRAFSGVVLSAFFVAKLAAAPLTAAAADRWSTRAAFAVAMSLCAAGNVAYACSTDKWQLLAARVCAGLGAGADGVTTAFVTRALPRHEATQGVLALRMAFGVGQVAAPAAGWLVTLLGAGWRADLGPVRLDVYTIPSLLTAAACVAFVAIGCPTIVEPPRGDAPAQPLKPRHAARARGDSPAAPAGSLERADSHPGCCGTARGRSTVLILCAFACVFASCVFSTVNVPLIAHNFGWGASQSSLLGTALGLAGLVAATLLRAALRRWPAALLDGRVLATATSGIGLGALLVTSLFNTDEPFSGNIKLGQFVVGAALLSACTPAGASTAGGAFRKQRSVVSNLYMAIYTSSINVARIAAPLLGGWLHPAARPGDPDWAMFAAAGFTIAAVLVLVFSGAFSAANAASLAQAASARAAAQPTSPEARAAALERPLLLQRFDSSAGARPWDRAAPRGRAPSGGSIALSVTTPSGSVGRPGSVDGGGGRALRRDGLRTPPRSASTAGIAVDSASRRAATDAGRDDGGWWEGYVAAASSAPHRNHGTEPS